MPPTYPSDLPSIVGWVLRTPGVGVVPEVGTRLPSTLISSGTENGVGNPAWSLRPSQLFPDPTLWVGYCLCTM